MPDENEEYPPMAIPKNTLALLVGLGAVLPACSGSFTAIEGEEVRSDEAPAVEHEDAQPEAIP
jgi:hypothetical protein